jgi:hypothetical protein
LLHCLLGKRKKFSRAGLLFFRDDDSGGGDLVFLYLVTQKWPEDKNLMVGKISYGLESLIIRIEKYSFSQDLWKIFQTGSVNFAN